MNKLLSVEAAKAHILNDVLPMSSEYIPLAEAGGRILAEDIVALRTQPPFAASAMDGYAVRQSDLINSKWQKETAKAQKPRLRLIGESAAGHGFKGSINPGETVRIFTGAPLPQGADTIIIQENTMRDGDIITILEPEKQGRYIRPAGLDFHQGDILLKQNTCLNASFLSLAAAMNHPNLPVRGKPRVAIIASGDELCPPGTQPNEDQIIASNSFGLMEIVKNAGAEPIDLGIARDTLPALHEKLQQTHEADLIITLGGASVGDHDLVHQALNIHGVELNFWKLAMRPGKPVMFGRAERKGKTQRYIGLPGNPVSSLVCALVFVVPLIQKMLGQDHENNKVEAILDCDLNANDQREEYMRAIYTRKGNSYYVMPFDSQDSSILSLMARANCLIIRPAHAEKAQKGDSCTIIPLS